MMYKVIKEYFRRKALKSVNGECGTGLISLEKVKIAGFLYKMESAEDIEALKEVVEVFNGSSIKFSGIAAQTGKVFRSEEERAGFADFCSANNIVFIERKDIDWKGVPSMEECTPFLNKKYDLFLSLNDNGNYTLNYLSMFVKAGYHVGMQNNTKMPYNVVMEKSSREMPLGEYIGKVLEYLSGMKTEV